MRVNSKSTREALLISRDIPRRILQRLQQAGPARLLAVVVQLGLVLLVIHFYGLEKGFGLPEITPLIFGGFIVHALLPHQARMPFYFILSLVGIGVVLGFGPAAVLIGLGLLLIATCHLPFRFSIRVALLAAVGIGLAAVRGEWILGEWTGMSRLVLPILGSMFMFRLIVYMYDLRHERQPASLWERLSYFFMLPNVCFLLFPVVDYRTFRRTYYNEDPHLIYQKGITWIFRGVVHLLLYRIVYYNLLPSASEVMDLSGVLQYMVGTYLLYLRISGQFHLIVGIMCLFGFNLPETHHLYYLASSFNDYWRRINIYWKDFMMKVFYYPSLNKLRRYGLTVAIVVSTALVFVGTWLLHSYQWFWLQGTFPLTAPDAVFWGILGILVVLNSVYEATRGRRRSLGTRRFTWIAALRHALKVVGMLLIITVLWTLWSSESLREFAALMKVAMGAGPTEWLLVSGGMLLLVAVGVLFQYLSSRGIALSLGGAAPTYRKATAATTAGLVVLLIVASPAIQDRAGAPAMAILSSLRSDGLNDQDEQRQLLGYYEGLLDSRGFSAAKWEVRGKTEPPADWGDLNSSVVTRETGDILQYELRPHAVDTVFRAPFAVNRWGMRDSDYEKLKPSSTFRIAMLGASYVVGAGVEQHETFEARLEEYLNEGVPSQRSARTEVLNFAVGGYDPLRTLIDVRRRVLDFSPDMVCYVVHANDGWRMQQNLATVISKGYEISEPHIRKVLSEAGVDTTMPRSEVVRRLSPYVPELLDWTYASLAALLRENGIRPVAFVLPRIIEAADKSDTDSIVRTVDRLKEAGFHTFNLINVYGENPTASLWLGSWDEHPNPLGHRLIAKGILRDLTQSGTLRDTLIYNRRESAAEVKVLSHSTEKAHYDPAD